MNGDASPPEVTRTGTGGSMGPFLEARLWLRQARRGEVVAAFTALALATALTAWAAVPVISGPSGTSILGVAGTNGTNDPGASGGSPSFGPGARPGLPSVGPSSGFKPGSPTTGRITGPRSNATSGPNPSSPSRVVLRASDQGITASTIKVGFAQIDLAAAQQLGIGGVAGLRTDIPQAVAALVDDANKRGGVWGRRIVPVVRQVDVVNTNAQQQACVRFTETDKVFALMDSISMLYPASRACVTVQHKVPLITGLVASAKEVASSAPYEISPAPDQNTIAKRWVQTATAAGFFDQSKGFKRLGILTDNCDRAVIDDAAIGLKAWLRKAGITTWDEYTVNCTIQDAESVGPMAVLRHRQNQDTHVLLAVNSAAVTSYLNAANGQGWKPRYFTSALYGNTNTATAKDFNASQWDGVVGVQDGHNGELESGLPLSPRARACSKILTDHGLKAVKNYDYDSEILLLCDNFNIFLKAAQAAPPNLTRQDFGHAVPTLGIIDNAFWYPSNFRPGSYAGGGAVRESLVQWHASCTCYRVYKRAYAVPKS